MILIAESKTMATDCPPFAGGTTPLYLQQADEIMASVAAMTPGEVAAMLRCSGAMAAKALSLAKAFGCVPPFMRAIDAFTGVVFRALDADTLSAETAARCRDQVRFISSVYGLLRPDDTILPYRMDYGVTVPGISMPLKKFWRTKLTVQIGKWMQQHKPATLILVLPADATACLDLKTLRALGNVATVELRTYKDNGRLTTPRAERLKNRRGLLVRQLLEANVQTPEDLERFSSPDFEYLGQMPYPGHFAFLC